MAKRHHRCERCGTYDHICGPISARGLCHACASAAVAANLRALAARQGPAYEAQQRASEQGMLRYMTARAAAKRNAPPSP